MKQRILVFFGIFLFSFTSFAQIYLIDKGKGDFRRHAVSVTLIQFIEKNEPSKINRYLAENCLYDSVSLDSNALYISILSPFEYGVSPGSFIEKDSVQNWYTRTYYEKENGIVTYKAQIFIELIKEGAEYKVAKLEFRFGDKIMPIQDEIDAVNASNEDQNIPPPAPPAPPGFE